MEWSREKIVELIAMYETEECLWNVRSCTYKNLRLKQDALNKIADLFNTTSIDVEKKLRSLLTQYRRERRKIEESKRSGSATEALYTPTWFGFRHLRFLDDIHTPKETRDTMDKEVLQDSPTEVTCTATEEASGSSSSPSTPPPPPLEDRQKRWGGRRDTSVQEASKILKKILEKYENRETDECTIVGKYVASQLRALPTYERALTKQKIYNVLSESEINIHKRQLTESSVCMNMARASTSADAPALFLSSGSEILEEVIVVQDEEESVAN